MMLSALQDQGILVTISVRLRDCNESVNKLMNREKNSENYHEAFDRQLFASHSHSHHSNLYFHASDLDSGSDRQGSRSKNDNKIDNKIYIFRFFSWIFCETEAFQVRKSGSTAFSGFRSWIFYETEVSNMMF